MSFFLTKFDKRVRDKSVLLKQIDSSFVGEQLNLFRALIKTFWGKFIKGQLFYAWPLQIFFFLWKPPVIYRTGKSK